MYLSRIDLNIRSRQARAEMADLYQMHRTLSKAFGDEPEDYKSARVLFRIDTRRDSAEPYVIVQSLARPKWERLTLSTDYLLAPVRVKSFDPQPAVGQTLVFRLRANPTVKRDGKRWGLVKDEEQIEWLRRKGCQHGFEVLKAYVHSDSKSESRTAKGLETTHLAVVFEGTLRITDAEAFREALKSGIGSAKGFGFGLLSVAPVRR